MADPVAETAASTTEVASTSTIASPSRDKNGNIVERDARIVGRKFEDVAAECKAQIETIYHRTGKSVTLFADEIRERAETEAHALLGHEGHTLPTEPIVKTVEADAKTEETEGKSEAEKVEDDAKKVIEDGAKTAAETVVKDAVAGA